MKRGKREVVYVFYLQKKLYRTRFQQEVHALDFFTVGTSLIPIAIRIILMLYTDQKLVLKDFQVEIFFLTIIFFVDAIKNFQSGSWWAYFTLFLLIITSTLYSLVMAENLKLLNVTLSKFADTSTLVFGVGSFLIDVLSLIIGDD